MSEPIQPPSAPEEAPPPQLYIAEPDTYDCTRRRNVKQSKQLTFGGIFVYAVIFIASVLLGSWLVQFLAYSLLGPPPG